MARSRLGWSRQETLVLLGVFSAAACATPTEDPIEAVEVPSTAGVGGDTAGMAGVGGAGGAMGGTGGSGGTAGANAGNAGSGNAGMGGTAGMGTGGTAGADGGAGSGGASGTGGSAGTNAGGKGGASGTGGTGGNAGDGGSGGKAGASGAGGKGGASGASGTGGKAGSGSGGSGTTASGCAELSVPLNAADDKAHFTISLNNPADLSDPGTTISLRIYVEDGEGGRIFAYAQDSSYNFLGPAMRPLLAMQQGWQTLTWNVAAEPTVAPALDKTDVTRIGIEIQAAPSMSWSNPTVVYVDSISVDSPALSFPFATTGTVSTSTNQTSDPSSQVLWLNSGSSDTTATGTTVSWVASCP